MARYVFEAVGTRGDLEPLLALAREMNRRGHTSHMLGPRPFEAEAKASDIEFTAIVERAGLGPKPTLNDCWFPGFEAGMACLERLAAEPLPLRVVNIDRTSTSNLACEAYGLSAIRLHLAPFKIRSLVSPPFPYAARARGPLGRTYLAHTLPKYFAACDTDARLLTHINERRLSWSLPPISTAYSDEPYVSQQIGLFPDWYCSRASDWPSALELLGFPLSPVVAQLPPEVERFIVAEGPPLVFTTGTGVSDVAEFFRHAADCCRALDRPGVLISPHLPKNYRAPGASLLAVPFVELGALLPRSALIVHHGGIGTTARAFEAGVPQVVSPMNYDQPDNAERVAALGVGCVLDRTRLSGAELAVRALELLNAPACASKLATLAERVARDPVIAHCADRLERRSPNGPPHAHECRDPLSGAEGVAGGPTRSSAWRQASELSRWTPNDQRRTDSPLPVEPSPLDQ